MGDNERFWLEEPKDLFRNFDIRPQREDTWEEQLNAITRLVILIAIISALLGWRYWLLFLIVSLILIVLIYFSKQEKTDNSESFKFSEIENFDEDYNNFRYYNNFIKQDIKKETYKDQITMAENIIDDKPVTFYYEHIVAPKTSSPQPIDEGTTFSDENNQSKMIQSERTETKEVKTKKFNIRRKPKSKYGKKTAYEHMRDYYKDEDLNDTSERDRKNLFGSIL